MQEDQMYAMQDYIQQYQQLVCRFRSENASLRRQLMDERSTSPVELEPQSMPQTQPNWPANKNGTPIEATPAPGINKQQVPAPSVETPDVPPLKQGASINADNRYRSLADDGQRQDEQNRYAQLASYESPVTSDAPSIAAEPTADTAPTNASTGNTPTNTSPDVLLSGEVVANNVGGGLRLVIDLESFDRSGRIARFEGNVSLALLATVDGVQHKLARWDFGPEDVRSAVAESASELTMRFRVELPAGTKVDGATELWARLTPTSGDKVLSHAKLDLSRPGVFSSRTNKIWASEESVVAASYVDTSSKPAEIVAPINEGTWAIALPGKPAILPPESDQSTGGWKAASGPIPAVIANTTTPTPTRIDRPAPPESNPPSVAPVEIAQKPAWTPERPGAASHTVRPTWSATR